MKKLGELKSVESGPKRNVLVEISKSELRSEIGTPHVHIDPTNVTHYEIAEFSEGGDRIWDLRMNTASGVISFYRTKSRFDLILLLDELDGTIGVRERVIAPNSG